MVWFELTTPVLLLKLIIFGKCFEITLIYKFCLPFLDKVNSEGVRVGGVAMFSGSAQNGQD